MTMVLIVLSNTPSVVMEWVAVIAIVRHLKPAMRPNDTATIRARRNTTVVLAIRVARPFARTWWEASSIIAFITSNHMPGSITSWMRGPIANPIVTLHIVTMVLKNQKSNVPISTFMSSIRIPIDVFTTSGSCNITDSTGATGPTSLGAKNTTTRSKNPIQ